MTTIINTPPSESGSVMELILGIVAVTAIITLFFVYALPAIRNMSQQQAEPTTINVEIPTPTEIPAELKE